ncbi:hypothetical protein HCI99_06025 [Listeria booriae]|uniref:Uncharacterized protein n=1 Tax=Listeria booriae TaxID=1552123 RepID=A0A7X0XBX8_9LIST|nr:hypothetical protein [Listeria booriae]MBC1491379.1 hypothetical protein [Listeria booriae]
MTLTKEDLARSINSNIHGLSRLIETNYTLDYEEGDIITIENAESWTDGGQFTVESTQEYTYCFTIENSVPCHVVDYTNEEETDVLSAVDCEHEKEVLIAAGTKFKVAYVSNDDDFAEMGYYAIDLEYVEED